MLSKIDLSSPKYGNLFFSAYCEIHSTICILGAINKLMNRLHLISDLELMAMIRRGTNWPFRKFLTALAVC